MADQLGETAYSRLVRQITEIENSVSMNEEATADISGSFMANPSSGKAPTYKSLLDVINEIEKKGRPQPTRPVPKPAPQTQVAQPAKPAEAQVQQPVQQEELAQLPVAQKESPNVYAGKELAALSKALPVRIPRFGAHRFKKANAADLVLPNLSLADQIAELERILEGINSGVVHGDDIGTARDELYGLVEQVNLEKKKLTKGKPPSPDDYAALQLRDKRIEDVMAALERAEKAGE